MVQKALAIVTMGLLVVMLSPLAISQTAPAGPIQTGDPLYAAGKNSFAGPSLNRYVPTRDPEDRRIDMFMGDWRESMPRAMHGSLVVRDILTHGDSYAPPQKAAILHYTNFVAHAILSPHASTMPDRLNAQQEVFYITGGTGTITAAGVLGQLHKDIAVFMPANLEFVMKNTGDEPLTMYIINEPIPANFKVGDKMLYIDERKAHWRAPEPGDPYIVPGASGHWGHIVRELFARQDGLATIRNVITVELPPLSLGEPHPHRPGTEEIWTALEGTSLAWESAELRLQKPGMTYMIRQDGIATHSNINFGDTTVKFLYYVAGPRAVLTFLDPLPQ